MCFRGIHQLVSLKCDKKQHVISLKNYSNKLIIIYEVSLYLQRAQLNNKAWHVHMIT